MNCQDKTPEGCAALLADLEDRIRDARPRSALAVNSELISLYWTVSTQLFIILANMKLCGIIARFLFLAKYSLGYRACSKSFPP